MVDFWRLTDQEIREGLDIMHDSKLSILAIKTHYPQAIFVWDSKLQRMALMLEACGWDRDLMRLQYADALIEIGSRGAMGIQWYGSNLVVED
jgi:hypothetical protein